NDPRAFGPARLAGELCRRSVDLPLAPGADGLGLPLQPGRTGPDGFAPARAVAFAGNRNRSADPVALPARERRPPRNRIRPAGAGSLLAIATIFARAGRVRFGLEFDPEHPGRPGAPVGNAAAATVARVFRPAGRPDAHAHGAVRIDGAEPAPHAAPGRNGPGQARATA